MPYGISHSNLIVIGASWCVSLATCLPATDKLDFMWLQGLITAVYWLCLKKVAQIRDQC